MLREGVFFIVQTFTWLLPVNIKAIPYFHLGGSLFEYAPSRLRILWFSSVPQANSEIVTHSGHDHSLPNPFQTIIYQTAYRPDLYIYMYCRHTKLV